MPNNPLQVRLEVTDQHSGQCTLSFDSSQYSIRLNPEGSFTIRDWLRRLPPVLAGENDPAGSRDPQDLLRNVGTWLWQELLPESAPTQEREALAHALRTGHSPLLLALSDTLAGLPWELLYDPQFSGDRGFLARHRPLIRLSPSAKTVLPIEPPLRILLLISSPPSLKEDSRVDVESERAAVEHAVHDMRQAGLLHLCVEDIVTPKRVQRVLMRFKPHMVHYIGHGGYNETDGGLLFWEDEQGNELPVSAERLANLLRPRNLHAVVLHACQTGRHNTRTNVLGVASTLVKEGIPAVLAQQANFTYESSLHASEAWYTALTAGQSFAEALFEVHQALTQADRPDWAVPILYGSAVSLTPLFNNTTSSGSADPLLTSMGPATDLPTPTSVFVGRHNEMRKLCLMLEGVPGSGQVMALITGPGGVGKSTLVAQAVTRYGRTYKAALTLHCQGYQGVDLFLQRIGEFLKRLGTSDFLEQILPDPKRSTEAKIEEAIDALNATGPLLLVIDNLESVQNDDQTIRDEALLYLLQKLLTNLRGGRVLITGRYAVKDLLPQGKFAANLLHLNLDDLSSYETNLLLQRHPTLARLGETVRRKLIEEFGGLPYVYDLLSSDAAGQSFDLLIHDVQGRITQERKRHTSEEWQEVRRQVAEFAALDATVSHLPVASRMLLAQLGVLYQPFPLAAIEEGLGASRTAWQPLLDWSLLCYDLHERTYHLHNLTRHYAEGLLEEQPRKQAQRQLARWYQHYAARKSHELADYLEAHRLWRAAGDVQLAGNLALELTGPLMLSGLYARVHELCMATVNDVREGDVLLIANTLFTLGTVTRLECDYERAQGLLQRSLDLYGQLGNQIGQRAVLVELGVVSQSKGDYKQAQKFLQQSLDLFKQPENQTKQGATSEEWANQSIQGGILHELGHIALAQGDYEQAQRLYQQSLEIKKQLGDLSGQGVNLNNLGNLARIQNDYEEAQRLYQQSLDLLAQQDYQYERANTLLNLGRLAQERGDYEEALQLYEQGLDISEQLGNLSGQAVALYNLGEFAQIQEEHEQAWNLLLQSLKLFERLGNLSGQIQCLLQLGRVAQKLEKFEEMYEVYQHNQSVFERLGNPNGQVMALYLLGMIAYKQGKYEEVRDHYQHSLDLLEQHETPSLKALNLHMLGALAREQGEYKRARKLYEQSLVIEEQQGNQSEQAISLHELGFLAELNGDYEQARMFYQRSLVIKKQLGDQPGQAATLHQLGRIAQELEDYDQARNLYQESLVIDEQQGNQPGQAATLHQLGRIAQELEDYDQARNLYQESLVITEQQGNQPGQAATLYQLGRIAQELEDYDQARNLYQESLVITERQEDQPGQAASLYQLGRIAQELEDYDQARNLYQESLLIAERQGKQNEQASILFLLGTIAQEQEDYEQARQLHQRSLTMQKQLGNLHGQEATLYQLGNIAQEQKEHEEARRYYQQSLAIGEQLGDQRKRAKILSNLAIIAQQQGEYEEARRLYQQSLASADQLEDQSGQASTLYQLGRIAQDQGEDEHARPLYQRSLSLFKQLGYPHEQAKVLRQLGIIAEDAGEYEAAYDFCQQSLDLFKQSGDLPGQAMTLHDLGMITQMQGKYAQANAFYRQSLTMQEHLGDLHGQAMTLHQLGGLAAELEEYEQARRLLQQSVTLKERLGDQSGQARSLRALGLLAYQQKNFASALQYTVQAYMLLDALQSPDRVPTQHMISKIRSQMDEETFRDQWRALTGDRLLIAVLEQEKAVDPEKEEVLKILALLQVISSVIFQGTAEQRQQLASQLPVIQQQLPSELGMLGDFFESLAEALRRETPEAALVLWQAFQNGWSRSQDGISQQGKETQDIDEYDVLAIEELPSVVSSVILQGTAEQRQQFAAELVEAQQQLQPEVASLGRFLGCLAAALRGEVPEAALLEAPFMELWQAFQDALSASVDESSYQEEGKDG